MTAQPVFVHGAYPTSAQLNALAALLDEAHDLLGDVAVQLPAQNMGEGSLVTIIHTQRYLHYGSTGAIVDPNGAEEDISLNENETGWRGVYDLDAVPWLFYGATYNVSGVTWAQEDYEP